MSGDGPGEGVGVARWKRRAVGAFVAFFLFVQVTLPLLGLRARAEHGSFPFSWHMFSTLAGVEGDAAGDAD